MPTSLNSVPPLIYLPSLIRIEESLRRMKRLAEQLFFYRDDLS
jgi:hypothetical protein